MEPSRRRVRVQFHDSVKLPQETEGARRFVMSLPPQLLLVGDLAQGLKARLSPAVPLQSLSLSIGDFTLLEKHELHSVVRDGEVVTVREVEQKQVGAAAADKSGEAEAAGSPAPAAKRRRGETRGPAESAGTGGALQVLENRPVGPGPGELFLVSSADAAQTSREVLAACGKLKDSGRRRGGATAAATDALASAKKAALERADRALHAVAAVSEEAAGASENRGVTDAAGKVAADEEERNPEQHVASKGGGGGDEEFRLFIGGLPFSCDEGILRKDFEECGRIVDLHLMTDRETGRSRGMAFVTFADAEGYKAALAYDGDDYGGRTLKVCKAEGKKGGGKGKIKDSKGKGGRGKRR